MPRWLLLLVAVFIAKGIFLASVGTAWYGEDEVNHFGYIEALARTGRWYAFADNLASVELDVSRRLVEHPGLRVAVVARLAEDELVVYQDLASVHHNATAYQPPLYYWLMARVMQLLAAQSVVSQLFVLRYLNVLMGTLVVLSVYILGKRLEAFNRNSPVRLLLMVSMIAWLPLFSLLAASVTVQVFIILVYVWLAILVWELSYLPWRWSRALWVSGLMGIGLLTQQAFLAVPVWVGGVALLAGLTKRWQWRQVFGLLGLLVACLVLVYPHYLQRHREVEYVVSREEKLVTAVSAWQYVPREYNRLKDELVAGFWDMRRSFVPYYASEAAKRAARLTWGLAAIGLIAWLYRRRFWLELHRFQSGSAFKLALIHWVVLGMGLTVLFLLGHGGFDLFQLRYGEQAYFKARYFYPLLPWIVWGVSWGWFEFWRKQTWQPAVHFGMLWLWIFMQGSAVLWLVTHLQ